MFPHTITIYKHTIENKEDVYTKQTLSGFYWNEKTVLDVESKGTVNVVEITVISSPEMAKTYGTGWICDAGDYIMKGEGSDITSIKEIPEAVKVIGVAVNMAGTKVDNIAITSTKNGR